MIYLSFKRREKVNLFLECLNVFLGIDTSCYTTSLAVVDEHKNLLGEEKIIFPVSTGKQGLRQSTALFYNLQKGMKRLK